MDHEAPRPDVRADAVQAAASGQASRSTHFLFEHKVFSIKGAVFRIAQDTGEPLYHVVIGDLNAGITLPSLRNTFDIAESSNDGMLLNTVEKGLRYVKEIRPGDSIPGELLDGSASWSVEERHLRIARKRLGVHLAAWIAGDDAGKGSVNVIELERLAEDPETRQRVQNAFEEAAARLGLDGDRQEDVVDRFETLARELAYIEALRDRYDCVRKISQGVAAAGSLYKRERNIAEEIARVQTLLRNPIFEFDNQFGLIDAQCSEILTMLRKMDRQIAFIRQNRDDLHFKLMKWDDLIAKWQAAPMERGDKIEALIRDTYRFVAQHYAQRSSWQTMPR